MKINKGYLTVVATTRAGRSDAAGSSAGNNTSDQNHLEGHPGLGKQLEQLGGAEAAKALANKHAVASVAITPITKIGLIVCLAHPA